MTRWTIEKDGTGIEKSGTGIEKSGTGIEKSGTGIEKSGTGIEKSGTGIRKGLLALSMASIAFASQINANQLQPEGTLNLVVQNDTLLVSWIIDGSIFSGVATLNGTTTNLSLTEISLANQDTFTEVTGGGTGIEVTGGGTGIEVTGGGTGIEVTGGGTGRESIAITLRTGLEMEITLGCQTASVSVLDANFTEVVSFNNIQVMGNTGLCESTSAVEPSFNNTFRRGQSNWTLRDRN